MPEHEPIGPQAILAKKQRYLIPCSYHFYRDPPQIVRGQGVYVYDSTGRRCTDLYSGVSVHALGHCHPEMVETICRQVAALQHTSTIYLTEPIVNLAEQLAKVLPGQICRTFFYCSGSEANEGAALLATLHTGRSEFLAFQNGLHGRTKLGMSLTGLSFWRTDPNPIGGIVHVPPPHCRSCPFGQSLGQCQYQCVDAVEAAIRTATSGKPAAIERNRPVVRPRVQTKAVVLPGGVRTCGCGVALPKGKRLCDQCRAKNRRQAMADYMRRRRKSQALSDVPFSHAARPFTHAGAEDVNTPLIRAGAQTSV